MKYKGPKFQGPDHLAPYPLSRQAPAVELVEIAAEIAAADDLLALQAARSDLPPLSPEGRYPVLFPDRTDRVVSGNRVRFQHLLSEILPVGAGRHLDAAGRVRPIAVQTGDSGTNEQVV